MGFRMILGDLLRGLTQIFDPAFRGVLWKALGLTILLLWGAYAVLAYGLVALVPETWNLPFGLEVGTGLFTFAALLGVFGLSFILMFPVAALFVGLFLDEIAAAVESRHYPSLPPVEGLPLSAAMPDALRFLGLVCLANVLALALYLALPPLAPVIFVAVNGWLIGQEYFMLAAARRCGRDQARALARANRTPLWIGGMALALPMSVPLLNLIVPLWGAAGFTHAFHRLSRGQPSP
jgi:uncharacterized protein involved in cysteine biosynthesis